MHIEPGFRRSIKASGARFHRILARICRWPVEGAQHPTGEDRRQLLATLGRGHIHRSRCRHIRRDRQFQTMQRTRAAYWVIYAGMGASCPGILQCSGLLHQAASRGSPPAPRTRSITFACRGAIQCGAGVLSAYAKDSGVVSPTTSISAEEHCSAGSGVVPRACRRAPLQRLLSSRNWGQRWRGLASGCGDHCGRSGGRAGDPSGAPRAGADVSIQPGRQVVADFRHRRAGHPVAIASLTSLASGRVLQQVRTLPDHASA